MGPELIWGLSCFGGVVGTLQGTYRVYSRNRRIPGLRGNTRAHGFSGV